LAEKKMKKNMSQTDRIVRILLFVFAVALYATGSVPNMVGIGLVIITSILAITSFVGFCLVYGILGLTTIKKK
jgi:hypothetical protein